MPQPSRAEVEAELRRRGLLKKPGVLEASAGGDVELLRLENELKRRGLAVPESSPGEGPTVLDVLGMDQPSTHPLGKLGQGAVKGMLSTIRNVNSLAPGFMQTPQGSSGRLDAQLGANDFGESVGKGIEQGAEFLLPAGQALKLKGMLGGILPKTLAAILGEGAVTGGTAYLQTGGDLEETGKAMAVGGAFAGAGEAAKFVGPKLAKSAKNTVFGVLRPGTAAEKLKLGKHIREFLERRVTARSLESLGQKTAAEVESLGNEINRILEAVPPDRLAPLNRISESLDNLAEAVTIKGGAKTFSTDQAVLDQINSIKQTLVEAGPELPIADLVKWRRELDKFVSSSKSGAGFLTPEIGAAARVKREAANAIRAELNKQLPELAEINRQYTFWKSIDEVVQSRLAKDVTSAGSIASAGGKSVLGGGMGAAIGSATGLGTGLGAGAGVAIGALLRSPGYKLVNAAAKAALADLIAAGKISEASIHAASLAAAVATDRDSAAARAARRDLFKIRRSKAQLDEPTLQAIGEAVEAERWRRVSELANFVASSQPEKPKLQTIPAALRKTPKDAVTEMRDRNEQLG